MGGSFLPLMTDSSPSVSRTAWLIVALLFPVALLNYLDRQMIASMKNSVMGDIPSIGSEANWGYMLGQFKWVYAFFSPIGGYIADRFSRKYTIVGSLLIWSLITYLTGHVSDYHELLWARTAMGRGMKPRLRKSLPPAWVWRSTQSMWCTAILVACHSAWVPTAHAPFLWVVPP